MNIARIVCSLLSVPAPAPPILRADRTASRLRRRRYARVEARQTKTLAEARQAGTLSLALRNIADLNQVDIGSKNRTRLRAGINVVRYGVSNPTITVK
ncbi:MAG: hypothetical protein ACLQDM_30860 [Bradyrhizobium sp.]